MPFMIFTTLLRGVDLSSIFFSLVVLLFIVCAAIQIPFLWPAPFEQMVQGAPWPRQAPGADWLVAPYAY